MAVSGFIEADGARPGTPIPTVSCPLRATRIVSFSGSQAQTEHAASGGSVVWGDSGAVWAIFGDRSASGAGSID